MIDESEVKFLSFFRCHYLFCKSLFFIEDVVSQVMLTKSDKNHVHDSGIICCKGFLAGIPLFVFLRKVKDTRNIMRAVLSEKESESLCYYNTATVVSNSLEFLREKEDERELPHAS